FATVKAVDGLHDFHALKTFGERGVILARDVDRRAGRVDAGLGVVGHWASVSADTFGAFAPEPENVFEVRLFLRFGGVGIVTTICAGLLWRRSRLGHDFEFVDHDRHGLVWVEVGSASGSADDRI